MSHLKIFLALASGTLAFGTMTDLSNYEMAYRTYFQGVALLVHWVYVTFILNPRKSEGCETTKEG